MRVPINLNTYIDHTLLKPNTQLKQIRRLCDEAIQYEFYSVCVNPIWVSECSKMLNGTDIKVCTVVGFPLGANSTKVKCLEIETAINDGANEFDMVINIGKLKDGRTDFVLNELKKCKQIAGKRTLKVIIETGLLNKKEIKMAVKLIEQAGCDFVKTSTGFNIRGVQVEDILYIKQIVSDKLKIKASGGVKTLKFTRQLIDAGAERIGTSNSVAIMSEWLEEQ